MAGRLIARKTHAAAPTQLRRDTSTVPREVKDPADPHEQRIAKLRERLIDVLHDKVLARTKVGMVVMRASDGDVLFAHNPAVPFNPASNTKMLTTAAALAYLGGDFRYHTALYGPEPDTDGVVHGNVVLRGSGDPSLTATDVADLARHLARRGVVKIEGDLYADPGFHDTSRDGRPRTEKSDEGVGTGALILNRNTYKIRVRPTDVGRAASVSIEPATDYFRVENQATTVRGKRTRLRIDSYRKDDKLVVTVRGRIADGRDDFVDVRRLADGALLTGAVLSRALSDFGVVLTGSVHTGSAPGKRVLATHESVPLIDVCKISNKPSNNFVADTIYKTLGGELYGQPGTLAKGTRAVSEYLAAAGIQAGSYKLVNGSGLTHENRIRPDELARLLRTIYFDVGVAPDFMSSLAVAGIDGTIRNRFLGTDAVGLVRAKTGTLSGVSALSGYVGDHDDVLVFTIFVQGFRNRRTNEVRHAQVRMVEAMLRYLRADAPSTHGEDSGGGAAGIDYESDGDPDDLPAQ